MNILIVDDEAMICEWIAFTLRKLPYDYQLLDTVTDGFEAMKKISLVSYDLVFVDITMPRMNGIELIKQMNTLPNLPMIVVLSSHDQFDYARQAFQLNASEYILKNECSKEKLSEILQQCQIKLKQKQLIMNRSYFRSSFLTSVLTDITSSSQIDLAKLFPELIQSSYFVITYNRYNTNLIKSNKTSIISQRIFIGNSKDLSFFAYLAPEEFDTNDIKSFLADFTKNNDLQIGCSQTNHTLNTLAEAIYSAFNAKQQLFYTDEDYLLLNKKDTKKTEVLRIDEQCALILNNIKSHDLDQARDNWSVLHHIITQAKPVDITNVKNINYNILSALLLHLSKNTHQVMPDLNSLKKKIESSQQFSEIKSYIDEYFYFFDPEQHISTEISSHYILEAINYIHTKYATIESISQIANRVHINTDYFSRLFKKEVGIPASTYLMNYKLEIAAQLLINTSDTIYEIALHVGYNNISYFSKIFKAKYNLQPSHYRKSKYI